LVSVLGGFGRFGALGIRDRDLEREKIIEPKIIAHLHKVGDVVKDCPRNMRGLYGDSRERLGGKDQTIFPSIAIPYTLKIISGAALATSGY
jgi:hypothetical protein